MPIGKEEVLATLNDPILTRINFSVGMLRVCVEMFRMVPSISRMKTSRWFQAEVTGLRSMTGSRIRLRHPARNPPFDFTDRAQLLHECVHAISDICGGVNALDDEVAGYLTQIAYSQISHPTPAILPNDAKLSCKPARAHGF